MLLSDDITPESRILLHRDVNDRLHTLAPFIQWDSQGVPLSADGRVVFVVEGYTTSANYPYADRVDLAGSQVNYARASVRATVDAFSGQVHLYLTDEPDPIAASLGRGLSHLSNPTMRCRPSCATGSVTQLTSSTPRRRPTRRSTSRDPTST